MNIRIRWSSWCQSCEIGEHPYTLIILMCTNVHICLFTVIHSLCMYTYFHLYWPITHSWTSLYVDHLDVNPIKCMNIRIRWSSSCQSCKIGAYFNVNNFLFVVIHSLCMYTYFHLYWPITHSWTSLYVDHLDVNPIKCMNIRIRRLSITTNTIFCFPFTNGLICMGIIGFPCSQ